MSITKEVRKDILYEGGSLVGHSLNQDKLHQLIEGEKKFFGRDRKAEKAEIRVMVNHWYENEYPTLRWQFRRSLKAVLNGRATVEHISYVLDHLAGFETEAGSSVTIIRLEEPHY